MDAALHDKILDILDRHRILTIATVRPDGWPQATTVGYVSRGLTLFFMTGPETQKAKNIARDNRVSLTVDHDVPALFQITGLSMAARAFPVADAATVRRVVMEEMPKRYPEYAAMMADIDLAGVALYELRPEVISVLDYSKGFAHTDEVTVRAAELAG
ncbi:MAG: pyridoxamine 5'-phosphate oxidase family protein [Rhizobiaceae bacterium]|nr:MAG: pyridoxamine 5'-phosphate oxidase family protein [Rhizobiaceae bacterium]CAG0977316.1 hypothetical protein RHIZO_01542 [Rhizobiaceae bacterium]